MCSARVTELLTGMDGVDAAVVDHKTSKATVTMKPGLKFDEAKAHELIDKDYTLVSCTELPATN